MGYLRVIKNLLFSDGLWRNSFELWLLKKRGITIGKKALVSTSAFLDPAGKIVLGDNVLLGRDSIVYSHDASGRVCGTTKPKRKTIIGNNVFVGARAIILSGVKIGNNVVVGAGSVVTKNVASNTVVAGNPAKKIETIKQLKNKIKKEKQKLKY